MFAERPRVREQGVEAHLDVLHRLSADQGDAVVGLLSADGAVVADLLKGLQREQVVADLGLLQAEHIRFMGLQPGQHLIQAGPHGIDVPAGDAHRWEVAWGCS